MNSFLFSAITLCMVATQCALAQYQSTPSTYGYQPQRKMAPTPQTYVPQQQQQQSYGAVEQQRQHYDGASQQQYGGAQMELGGYGAKNGASYGGEERAPASYGKQQSSYAAARPAAAAGYGQQQSGYSAPAKQAPRYEEPYYPPMPFAWGYDINDGYGGAQYHKENGDEYGKRTGSYGYTDAYGIYRQVDYVADEHGFRATIKTNEPGTANESPASVEMHAYEPPSNYYAGNQQQSTYSASKGSSYGAAAAAAPASSSSYGQQQQQRQSYSAPTSSSSYQQPQQQQQQYQRAPAVAAAAPAYGGASKGYSARPQHQQSAYSEAAQYLSSVIVPVYQKQTGSLAAKPTVAVAVKPRVY